MVWFVVKDILSTLLEWVRLGHESDEAKDLEILLLRRQLAIAERKLNKPLRISRVEKLTLAVLTSKLRATTNQTVNHLREVIRIVQPETVLKWHRELVQRKWSHQRTNRGGRPRKSAELERLVVRLAKENRGWGNGRITGECLRLGFDICEETVAHILRRHGIPTVPERASSPSWRHLMRHYKDQIVACGVFTSVGKPTPETCILKDDLHCILH